MLLQMRRIEFSGFFAIRVNAAELRSSDRERFGKLHDRLPRPAFSYSDWSAHGTSAPADDGVGSGAVALRVRSFIHWHCRDNVVLAAALQAGGPDTETIAVLLAPCTRGAICGAELGVQQAGMRRVHIRCGAVARSRTKRRQAGRIAFIGVRHVVSDLGCIDGAEHGSRCRLVCRCARMQQIGDNNCRRDQPNARAAGDIVVRSSANAGFIGVAIHERCGRIAAAERLGKHRRCIRRKTLCNGREEWAGILVDHH